VPLARIILWITSLAGLALLARTLLFEPPPLWFAISAMLAYVAFATLGVLVPQLEMYGDVLWRGVPGSRSVALTFDDGPHPRTTRQVLEILARSGRRATFFVVGRKARLYPDVVREIHEAGHAIGLHGYAHDRSYSLKPPSYVVLDIEKTQEAVFDACGVRPRLFRPPVGYVSSRTASGARKAGVTLVGWSARGIDGLGATDAARVVRRIEKNLGDGAIVLLHDASENEDFVPASIEALPELLKTIEARGLRTVTIEDLVEEPAPLQAELQGAAGSSITKRAPPE
jgi:peptidoglycan-N-acetylglucosamine deacetylase